jgi:hypothetical protein
MLTAAQRTVIFKGSSNWTPQQLPGLVAWYKADNDGTNIFSDAAGTTPQTTNAGIIACWKDRSGNGYHIINSSLSSINPHYTLAGLNGKPAVTFVAANSQLLRSAAGVAMGTGAAGSGFAIGTMNTGTNSSGRLISYAPPSASDTGSGGYQPVLRVSTTNFINTFKGGIQVATPFAPVSLATETRFGGIADGNIIQSYINGVAAGSTGSGSNAFISAGYIAVGGPTNSGGVTGGANYWDGNISEIVITNQAMTPTDVAKLDAYLVKRW